jgi:Spx/MgsR family transcriptional regulator
VAETEIYLYSSCTSCRQAEALLSDLDVETDRRDYFKTRFTKTELKTLLDRIGLTAHDVLSTRSRPYKALDLASKTVSEDELLDFMLEHPQLLRRPIVVRDNQATVGFNREAITALVKGR